MATTSARPRPSRELEIDGRPLRVYDGLIDNVDEYVRALSKAPFTRSEFARPETAEHKHWATEVALDSLLRQPILETTLGAVRDFTPSGAAYRPYRAYTNVATYGDMLFTHVDCTPDQHDLTALWYMCSAWDIEWGGETMFYDAAGEVACAVRPRPGRLVVFDGAIVHAGRPPNRIHYGPRYTFAIKFERVAATSGAGN